MPASPDELENKRFVAALRGYDKDEVDAYLRELAQELREAQAAMATATREARQDPYEDLGREVAAIARAAATGTRAMAMIGLVTSFIA